MSVWAARGLLQYGLCWRVGSGEIISIRDDLLLSESAGYRLNNRINYDGVRLVSYLIDAFSREWKADLIYNTFTKDVMSRILQIPLARENHEDMQVWSGESFGEFTVRST